MTRPTVLPNRLSEVTEASLERAAPAAVEQLAEHQRAAAQLRQTLIAPVLALVDAGVAPRQAALQVVVSIEKGTFDPEYSRFAAQIGGVTQGTLENWTRLFMKQGLVGLAPKHKGRVRGSYGWEVRAAAMFRMASKPTMGTVAVWLQREGYPNATYSRVRSYLKQLPSNEAETAPSRLGRHYYDQNRRPHKIRDSSVLPVGFVYTGDGHCFKGIVGHPETGAPWRPEVTAWLDVATARCVSYWVSEAESAQTTLFSLSQALIGHDHVPAFVHVDPGSGFKALLMTDDVTGFLKRFQIEPIFSLPGNARGKGLMEGFWRWMKERCAKRFNTYTGDDRTDDSLSRLQAKIKKGEMQLPTFEQFMDELRGYIAWYNSHPMDSLGGKSPDELWAGLERVALATPAEAVIRPRVIRTVRRWSVIHQKRLYRAADLQGYEGREVIVEYSLHDDARAWIRDLDGRMVCEAPLVEKIPWLPASRIEEGQQRRLEGQKQRLQVRIDEATARARGTVGSVSPAAIAAPEPTATEVSIARLQAAAVAETREIEQEETPEHRFARARALERATEMSDVDRQWLRIYQTSAEYSSRVALIEEFGEAAVASSKST